MKKSGFFTRIVQKALSAMVFPKGQLWTWLLPRTKYDYEKEVGGGTGSSVVMAPIFWICRRLAEAKIIIKKNDQVEDSHDILSLLKKPNPFYSGRLLRMAIALSYNLDGNVYILKVRNNQLKPIELWYVPHWVIEPHFPKGGEVFIDYYKYRPQNETIKIDPSEVIHLRFGIDPYNTRKGMAPLKSLFREIFTDDEAANFSSSLLRNMGIPGIVMSPGAEVGTVSEADKQAVKDAFKEKFGKDRRGEPLVMSSKTDIKEFGFTPSQMDLSKLREIPEERVTAILGVPAAVVGFGTGLQQTKVGATMKELRESAYEDCIIPMQNLIADELNTQLLPDFVSDPENWTIDFDLSEIRVLQEDENEKSKRTTEEMKNGLITQAEAREKLGYEVKPEHNVYFLPFSTVVFPAGNLSNQSSSAQDDGNNNGDGNKSKYILPYIFNTKDLNQNWRQKLAQAFMSSEIRLRDIQARELRKTLDALGDSAAEIWKRIIQEQGIERLAYNNVEKKDDQLDRYYADLIADEIDTDIIDYGPHYLRVGKETFNTIKSITGLAVNLTDPVETRLVQEGGTRKGLLDLKKNTKDAVFKALAESREAGAGPYEAAQKIKDCVSAGPWSSSKIRAKMIARTETKYCQNISSLEAYKQAGVSRVEIVDGQLSTSCEMCIERNGQIITIAEAYALDEHPNGTLSYTPVIESLS